MNVPKSLDTEDSQNPKKYTTLGNATDTVNTNNISIPDTQKQISSSISEILPKKPTAKEFLTTLEKENPEIFQELSEKYNSFKNLETYIEEKLQPVYFVKDRKYSRLSQSGLLIPCDYKPNESYALLPNGELIEYNWMGDGIPSGKEKTFLGYGIYWKSISLLLPEHKAEEKTYWENQKLRKKKHTGKTKNGDRTK